eukprot:COSAG04_NODE_12508_length_649_cov_1.265455_2_plen_53_part_01
MLRQQLPVAVVEYVLEQLELRQLRGRGNGRSWAESSPVAGATESSSAGLPSTC